MSNNLISIKQWTTITELVIDHVEGGYYHPSMLKNFNARSQAILAASGETLFGLDRKAGAALAKYPEWAIFWAAVDADRKANPALWKYQYRGGKLESKLKQLAAAIMYQWFNYLAKKYILVGSMDEISNDSRLLAHFSYASWNGEGWFKRYATALNKAIQLYEGNKEKIFQEAFKARSEAPSKAIRQQAVNMQPIFKKLA